MSGTRFRGGTFKSQSPGWIYTIHFDEPFGHARHYTGFTANLEERMNEHKAGRGSKLLAHVKDAGIGWHVASVEWSDAGKGKHGREGQLKWRGATRRCSTCKHEAKLDREAHTDLLGNTFTDAEIKQAEEDAMRELKLDAPEFQENHPTLATARDENAFALADQKGFGYPFRGDYAAMDPRIEGNASVAGMDGADLPPDCHYDPAVAEAEAG